MFQPFVSLNYTCVTQSKQCDSVGVFSNQSTQLGFLIPLWNKYNSGDSTSNSNYIQLLANGNGSIANPELTSIIGNQNLIGASAGLTGIWVKNRRNIFSVSLAAGSRTDETTFSDQGIRFSGIAIYRRNVSPGFSFHIGTIYSYLIGRGILLPTLGVAFKTGKRSRMVINFPNRISFVQRLGNKLMLSAYLKPQGGFNFIANKSAYQNFPQEFYLRQRESHIGITGLYRISRNFNVNADIGLAARRSVSLTDGLTKNATTYYKSEIKNGLYFGVGLKYIFNSAKKDKASSILNSNSENEQLLSDPDFYDIISE